MALLEIAGQTIEVDIDNLVDNLITITEELDANAGIMRDLIGEREQCEDAQDRAASLMSMGRKYADLIAGYEGEWGL